MVANIHSAATTEAPEDPIHLHNQRALENVVADHDIVLADFFADLCGPCQLLEPVVETIAVETGATVAKVDVEVDQRLPATCGVRGVAGLSAAAGAAGTDLEPLVLEDDEPGTHRTLTTGVENSLGFPDGIGGR